MTSHKSFIVVIGYYQKLFSYYQLDNIGIYGSISLVLMVSIKSLMIHSMVMNQILLQVCKLFPPPIMGMLRGKLAFHTL